jgi:deoxyribonuclease V
MNRQQAADLQNEAEKLVNRNDSFHWPPRFVAGADVSVRKSEVYAAVVVMDFPGLTVVETAAARRPMEFVYIPGLLAFREAPALLEAFAKLSVKPDVVMVDGHGISHPRFFGLASHLGLALDIPTIGVAKSRLVGAAPEPENVKDAWTELLFKDQVVGRVLRSRAGVKPIYVSIGHGMTLDTATKIVMATLTRYRLPEPVRAAHMEAGKWRV